MNFSTLTFRTVVLSAAVFLLSFQVAGAANPEPLWGQAYSPNIGWINFYCDGSGNTQPLYIRDNFPDKGAVSMPDSCDTVAYGVTFDPDSLMLSGTAYSSSYGWFDLDGLTFDAGQKELHTTTDGAAIPGYNFGTTYFEKDNPNEYNPGVAYSDTDGWLCGFAYSETVGFISFCDPVSKAGTAPVSGYDWDTYTVYLGIGIDTDAPTLTTPSQVLAATDNYTETLWFIDSGFTGNDSDIVSVVVTIRDSNEANQVYTANYFDPIGNRASVDISGHDFSSADNYDLSFIACDAESNCTDPAVPGEGLFIDFFQVVAATPDWSGQSYFEFGSPTRVADAQESHLVRTVLVDQYGNPVISVAGIKEVKVDFSFDNTTKLDQTAGTGDSAIFESSEFAFSQEGGSSTGFFTEAIDGDGIFTTTVKSYAPTSSGYLPISADGFDLNFKEIDYEVTPLDGYNNVGESSGTVASTDPNRIFAFQPALAPTPEALNFKSGSYVNEASAVNNITVNAPKRFNIKLVNSSLVVDAENPELGLIMDSSDPAVVWQSASAENPAEESWNLDTEQDDGFNGSWNDLTNVVDKVRSSEETTIRMRAIPELTAGTTAAENFDSLLQTYVSYDVGGKSVRHKGAQLETVAENITLFNPGIEIVGSVRSGSGVSTKQTGAALNQSLGDFVQNELSSSIDRNVVSFIADPNIVGCSAADMQITGSSGASFETLNIASCSFRQDSILYLEGDLTINLNGDPLPTGKHTILVHGGDLYIQGDLAYSASGDSLGVIVLQDSGGAGGNVYVYPNPTDLVGAFYAEGGVISVNVQGFPGEDLSASCNGSSGFCDRSYELRNQLYWKGLLATSNTIGGSDRNPAECPGGLICPRDEARSYDFAYLRTFHADSSGNTASNVVSSAALIIEYDSRIQTNPPPLFGSTAASSSSGEVGY
ncbi:MAG: hypothetical protein ABIH35_03285 [Patescibacteria group bacterium]